jgi:hypothetical protein
VGEGSLRIGIRLPSEGVQRIYKVELLEEKKLQLFSPPSVHLTYRELVPRKCCHWAYAEADVGRKRGEVSEPVYMARARIELMLMANL